QPNGQALAQAAADKAAAQQAAAAQAAAKADAQAASRPAPTRADAPAPAPQPAQSSQPQGAQQNSFANMLQQQAKTPDGAKAEQSGFQHQARAAHQSHAVAEQVAVQIRKGFQGMDRISIQMKPAELGRVDVEMRLDNQGRIAIVIQAEKPETLDMLQRESKTLEQSLKDAGFDLSDGALSFGSRGDGRGFAGRSDLDALAQLGAEADGALDDADAPAVMPADALRRLSNPDAIDVVV
ncbi:MAG: flagellar hook-length control protein FliK, partial [Pseudomonadota bacterium]